MGLQEDFEKAAEEAKTLPSSIEDEEKLTLYSLFKQGTIGDVNTTRPPVWDFTGRAKWDAWNQSKGRDKEGVQKQYIELVQTLKAKYNK